MEPCAKHIAFDLMDQPVVDLPRPGKAILRILNGFLKMEDNCFRVFAEERLALQYAGDVWRARRILSKFFAIDQTFHPHPV